MRHLDLFSGIGGFSIAAREVWRSQHEVAAFCDNDAFCQQVLRKHWPKANIYGDIRTIRGSELGAVDLVTGGFPCQPFSQAGKRRGTGDDRYLWPEMLRIIRETKPRWVIGENVYGFITWNGGMVLDQVLSDLEREGYEAFPPFIIPACAVNAPHRRNRVWIVAHAKGSGYGGGSDKERSIRKRALVQGKQERGALRDKDEGRPDSAPHAKSRENYGRKRRNMDEAAQSRQGVDAPTDAGGQDASNASGEGSQERKTKDRPRLLRVKRDDGKRFNPEWDAHWPEIATSLCGVDDGLPARVDGFELTKAKHREARIKALGNAIVPQIAIEIMRAIRLLESSP